MVTILSGGVSGGKTVTYVKPKTTTTTTTTTYVAPKTTTTTTKPATTTTTTKPTTTTTTPTTVTLGTTTIVKSPTAGTITTVSPLVTPTTLPTTLTTSAPKPTTTTGGSVPISIKEHVISTTVQPPPIVSPTPAKQTVITPPTPSTVTIGGTTLVKTDTGLIPVDTLKTPFVFSSPLDQMVSQIESKPKTDLTPTIPKTLADVVGDKVLGGSLIGTTPVASKPINLPPLGISQENKINKITGGEFPTPTPTIDTTTQKKLNILSNLDLISTGLSNVNYKPAQDLAQKFKKIETQIALNMPLSDKQKTELPNFQKNFIDKYMPSDTQIRNEITQDLFDAGLKGQTSIRYGDQIITGTSYNNVNDSTSLVSKLVEVRRTDIQNQLNTQAFDMYKQALYSPSEIPDAMKGLGTYSKDMYKQLVLDYTSGKMTEDTFSKRATDIMNSGVNNLTDDERTKWFKTYGIYQDAEGKQGTFNDMKKSFEKKGYENVSLKADGSVSYTIPTEVLGKEYYDKMVSDAMAGGRSKADAENLVAVKLAALAPLESVLGITSLVNVATDVSARETYNSYIKGLSSGKWNNPEEYAHYITTQQYPTQYLANMSSWEKEAIAKSEKGMVSNINKYLAKPPSANAELYRLSAKAIGYDEALEGKETPVSVFGFEVGKTSGAWAFPAKVLSSEGFQEGVMLPLATMGIGYGVTKGLGAVAKFGSKLVTKGENLLVSQATKPIVMTGTKTATGTFAPSSIVAPTSKVATKTLLSPSGYIATGRIITGGTKIAGYGMLGSAVAMTGADLYGTVLTNPSELPSKLFSAGLSWAAASRGSKLAQKPLVQTEVGVQTKGGVTTAFGQRYIGLGTVKKTGLPRFRLNIGGKYTKVTGVDVAPPESTYLPGRTGGTWTETKATTTPTTPTTPTTSDFVVKPTSTIKTSRLLSGKVDTTDFSTYAKLQAKGLPKPTVTKPTTQVTKQLAEIARNRIQYNLQQGKIEPQTAENLMKLSNKNLIKEVFKENPEELAAIQNKLTESLTKKKPTTKPYQVTTSDINAMTRYQQGKGIPEPPVTVPKVKTIKQGEITTLPEIIRARMKTNIGKVSKEYDVRAKEMLKLDDSKLMEKLIQENPKEIKELSKLVDERNAKITEFKEKTGFSETVTPSYGFANKVISKRAATEKFARNRTLQEQMKAIEEAKQKELSTTTTKLSNKFKVTGFQVNKPATFTEQVPSFESPTQAITPKKYIQSVLNETQQVLTGKKSPKTPKTKKGIQTELDVKETVSYQHGEVPVIYVNKVDMGLHTIVPGRIRNEIKDPWGMLHYKQTMNMGIPFNTPVQIRILDKFPAKIGKNKWMDDWYKKASEFRFKEAMGRKPSVEEIAFLESLYRQGVKSEFGTEYPNRRLIIEHEAEHLFVLDKNLPLVEDEMRVRDIMRNRYKSVTPKATLQTTLPVQTTPSIKQRPPMPTGVKTITRKVTRPKEITEDWGAFDRYQKQKYITKEKAEKETAFDIEKEKTQGNVRTDDTSALARYGEKQSLLRKPSAWTENTWKASKEALEERLAAERKEYGGLTREEYLNKQQIDFNNWKATQNKTLQNKIKEIQDTYTPEQLKTAIKNKEISADIVKRMPVLEKYKGKATVTKEGQRRLIEQRLHDEQLRTKVNTLSLKTDVIEPFLRFQRQQVTPTVAEKPLLAKKKATTGRFEVTEKYRKTHGIKEPTEKQLLAKKKAELGGNKAYEKWKKKQGGLREPTEQQLYYLKENVDLMSKYYIKGFGNRITELYTRIQLYDKLGRPPEQRVKVIEKLNTIKKDFDSLQLNEVKGNKETRELFKVKDKLKKLENDVNNLLNKKPQEKMNFSEMKSTLDEILDLGTSYRKRLEAYTKELKQQSGYETFPEKTSLSPQEYAERMSTWKPQRSAGVTFTDKESYWRWLQKQRNIERFEAMKKLTEGQRALEQKQTVKKEVTSKPFLRAEMKVIEGVPIKSEYTGGIKKTFTLKDIVEKKPTETKATGGQTQKGGQSTVLEQPKVKTEEIVIPKTPKSKYEAKIEVIKEHIKVTETKVKTETLYTPDKVEKALTKLRDSAVRHLRTKMNTVQQSRALRELIRDFDAKLGITRDYKYKMKYLQEQITKTKNKQKYLEQQLKTETMTDQIQIDKQLADLHKKLVELDKDVLDARQQQTQLQKTYEDLAKKGFLFVDTQGQVQIQSPELWKDRVMAKLSDYATDQTLGRARMFASVSIPVSESYTLFEPPTVTPTTRRFPVVFPTTRPLDKTFTDTVQVTKPKIPGFPLGEQLSLPSFAERDAQYTRGYKERLWDVRDLSLTRFGEKESEEVKRTKRPMGAVRQPITKKLTFQKIIR